MKYIYPLIIISLAFITGCSKNEPTKELTVAPEILEVATNYLNAVSDFDYLKSSKYVYPNDLKRLAHVARTYKNNNIINEHSTLSKVFPEYTSEEANKINGVDVWIRMKTHGTSKYLKVISKSDMEYSNVERHYNNFRLSDILSSTESEVILETKGDGTLYKVDGEIVYDTKRPFTEKLYMVRESGKWYVRFPENLIKYQERILNESLQ